MSQIKPSDLFRYFKSLPHQMAAVSELEEELLKRVPDLFDKGQPWFKTWSQSGKQTEPARPAWFAPARKIVAEFEGCVLKAPYLCPAGVATQGFGRTGPSITMGGPAITQAQADQWLAEDLQKFADGIHRLLPASQLWGANQQAALISWAFNVGLGAVESSTLRKRLLAGEAGIIVVPQELPKWDKANGKPLAGLTRRRAAEVRLFAGQAAIETQQQPAKPTGLAVPADMVGPRKAPPLKPGDHHLIADDHAEIMTAYSYAGTKLWTVPCLCRGQGKDAEWNTTGSDTPPGLYKVGKVYRDYEQNPNPPFTADRRAYGWYSFDLEGLEGQEGPNSKPHRDGIMIHGGGTACGWPGAWAPKQALHPTLGCIRLHNVDLRDRVLPLIASGGVWVSVLQEAS